MGVYIACKKSCTSNQQCLPLEQNLRLWHFVTQVKGERLTYASESPCRLRKGENGTQKVNCCLWYKMMFLNIGCVDQSCLQAGFTCVTCIYSETRVWNDLRFKGRCFYVKKLFSPIIRSIIHFLKVPGILFFLLSFNYNRRK